MERLWIWVFSLNKLIVAFIFKCMRGRLAHKVFALFFILSIAVVLGMILLMQQLTYRIFTTYAAERKLADFPALAEAVVSKYNQQGTLGVFDDISWRHFVAMNSMPGHPGHPTPLGPPPGGPPHEGPPPGGPPHEGPPHEGPELGRPPHEGPPPIVLLDAEQTRIAGPHMPGSELALRPLEVDGRVVGFLGIKILRDPSRLINSTYRERQLTAILITFGVAVVLSLVSALFFTRWLVKPIALLARGTRAIAQRDYSVNLPVRSRDDLGALAESFNEMAEALKRHEEMRTQWISDISHELRTPLSILRGEIEALEDGLRKPTQEVLANLKLEVIRLSRIVNDIHDLSMADNGTFRYDFQQVDPLRVVQQTLTRYVPKFEEAGIAIIRQLDTNMAALCRADQARLEQLLSNLLENTLRYTSSPGKLIIGYGTTPERTVITLEDSAPGVPEADLVRIFDRLYRVDKARSRETGGSGLGLAICKTIVQAHRGSIAAVLPDNHLIQTVYGVGYRFAPH